VAVVAAVLLCVMAMLAFATTKRSILVAMVPACATSFEMPPPPRWSLKILESHQHLRWRRNARSRVLQTINTPHSQRSLGCPPKHFSHVTKLYHQQVIELGDQSIFQLQIRILYLRWLPLWNGMEVASNE
jgi:hypothetical protein